jgi:pfkB family carbohydrate kinase
VFKLGQVAKEYEEAAALCSQVNLFGFADEEVFLTKSGDVGLILEMEGVDYECVDRAAVDHLTHRLAAAFRVFDEKCRVYQYLFKRNGDRIPFRTHQNPIVNTAVENRVAYLAGKAGSLYSFRIYYAIVYEGFRYRASLLKTIAQAGARPARPAVVINALRAAFSTRHQVVLIESEIERAADTLRAKVRSFLSQVTDFTHARTLPKQEAFRVLKRILNFAPLKADDARLTHDTFLDYYLCESHLECHRGFLRLDDYYVKVLTLKEPSAQTFPLIFKRLMEVEANYFVCSEWEKQDPAKSRTLIHSRRRHFHNTKRSLASYLSTSEHPRAPEDVLVDESKEAQIQDLGRARDTVGAGDAFAAAFLHGIINRWPVDKTALFANALGAVVAGRTGAIPDWTFKDVDQVLSGSPVAKRSNKQKKRQSRMSP